MWSASASSIHHQYLPNLAIDNDVNDQQVIFHSDDGDVLPWFQVQLEDSFTVLQVDVYNRRDSGNEEYFDDFENLEVHLFLIYYSFTYWNIFNISGEGGRHRDQWPIQCTLERQHCVRKRRRSRGCIFALWRIWDQRKICNSPENFG